MQKKAWGWTQLIFTSDCVEVHRIDVVRGGYCSMHLHHRKSNLFFVESGRLRVTTFSRDLRPLRSQSLHPGESFAVAPGVVHQFEAIEASVAYEIYSIENAIDPDDIIRHSVGGIKVS